MTLGRAERGAATATQVAKCRRYFLAGVARAAVDSARGPIALSLRHCPMAYGMIAWVSQIPWLRHVLATGRCVVSLMVPVGLLVLGLVTRGFPPAPVS